MRKKMMSKVIKDTHASDRESMDMILSKSLNTANEMTGHGGFAPTQWAFTFHVFHAALAPWVTKMNVSMWVLHKHMLIDQQPSVCSHDTERRHVKHSYDRTVVNELDMLLCERPLLWLDPTKLETVSYCREPRAGEHGLQWSVASRLISPEKDKNTFGETQPRTCWVIFDSEPVCVAIDRLTVRAREQSYWLFISHKPKVLYLLQQTLRHKKRCFTDEPASLLTIRKLLTITNCR